ncbi:MAG TPA: LysM peptidoglycan-binding domain-containing protein [Bacillota bacterium]|jgi:N-acetylmuramoyl-L-alanine amidase|nr:LysM peptidoglycan-binding domain-containing protein [Bacillota bacterium]HOB86255.1 LysM peptidoglycan-binding domain-containing protein [Bacillota bacterium]HOP68795.1 LysM peptidoglycan-binding domain-containing protein [Bacillota bacterium]HPT33838.1 LysM peptidoglycan-binding domain-containing protein [Bacillota bacterium]HQD06462.1 LysM peptidoglycan-binding domain-containing protein [Bacillota bacterium]
MNRRFLRICLLVVVIALLIGPGSAAAQQRYTVQWGDTVWLISQRFGTTVEAISKANNLWNCNLIYPGQTLIIPGSGSASGRQYQVVAGDTLWLISQRCGISLASLIAANNLSNPHLIYPGQLLNIPGPVSLPPTSGLQLSAADLDLFARLVHAEAAGEPYLGQVAVAASVLNRVKSPLYPNTVRQVILQVVNGYYQYSPVQDGRINLPAGASAHRAVQEALNGSDPSLGATGFYNPAKTSNWWVRSRPVTTVIGNHVFFK